jgi:alpha-L-fucosidase 2
MVVIQISAFCVALFFFAAANLFAAGIMEMLLQSRAIVSPDAGYEIELPPALPSAWPTGSVKGLCARGGFVVDAAWRDGKLTEATVHSLAGNPVRLCYGTTLHGSKLKPGETFRWNGQ